MVERKKPYGCTPRVKQLNAGQRHYDVVLCGMRLEATVFLGYDSFMQVLRLAAVAGSVLGFLGVAAGAFGAHALKSLLQQQHDGLQRLDWWDTAAKYQLIHAVVLVCVGLLGDRQRGAAVESMSKWSAVAFISGVLLFSGSLYVMSLTGVRWLGAVTPIGGILLLCGWSLLFLGLLRS